MRKLILGGAVFLPALFFFGCKKDQLAAPPDGAQAAQALVNRGKAVYLSVCIACHNSDPHQPGVLGPEIAGSSKELIEARVMRAEYPAGYSPKRPSHTMVALPHLKDEIDGLHAYLNSLQ